MAKHEEKAPETVSVTVTDIQSLVRDAVKAQVAAIMTAKLPDDQIREAIERQRGIGKPTAPEFLVACRSPITGATFTARLVESRSLGKRVVEMLDYQRPDGWDRKVQDGGLVEDGDQMPLKEADGSPGKRSVRWLYEMFWQRDANELGGKPLPDQWRADYAPAPGSVTLTPEQIASLGLTPEQLQAAVAEKAAE